ncbi:MAG TPA: protein kinase [Ktedonobacteraceae bacterium]|jgi:serine/threonine protein kinase
MIETVPSGTVLHRRYRIERVLGSGGFGHVYLAIDLANNQQYAVKEYLVTGTSGQEQLQHEASVLSQLHHPNLPAFQDAFTERGRYYIVLNYIEGNDLTDLIRMARQHNEVVPIGKILGWLLAVCNAVMFLHKQQPIVIHRDIKPDNIRITPSGTAILVDMGNAKAAADGVRTLFFIRHQGTPGYAPPEQYPGGSGTDARSDIYALGGTLYFALTAHEPPSVSIRNQSLQQGRPTLPSLQENHANNPPEVRPEGSVPPPFKLGVTKPGKPAPHHSRHIAQLGTLPPQLLKQLNAIIQKAMELTPKDRYNSVTDLAKDLQRVAKALPAASPPPPSSPTPSPSRPFDPNSTQPDLQEVYEALQAEIAKEQANQKQGKSGTSTPPLTQNQKTSATCPRCSTPLLANTGFCSRCGTPLSGPQMANTNVRDISAEQTLLVSPSQLKQAVATHVVKPQTTSSPASPPVQPNRTAQPPAGGTTPTPVLTQVSAPPAMQPPPIHNHQPQAPTQGPQQPSPSWFKIGPRGALFLIAIFVALVAIILILIIHH